jgi:HK97 family phage prohead protease
MTIRKAYSAEVTDLGPRSIRVVCSTDDTDLSDEVVEQDGIDLSVFTGNPIVLWSHNPEHPIGNVTQIGTGAKLTAQIDFFPEGMSHKADEICGLYKAGLVKGISIGFDPIETTPMQPTQPKGPKRYLKILMLELSCVSIPANSKAGVVQRAKGDAEPAEDWKCGAESDLPIDTERDWDGSVAADAIFEHYKIGEEGSDPGAARKGFLAYDASKPEERGSYKLPFAIVADGKLTALASGVRAAASRLPDTDIPDDVREAARKVLDGYEAKMTDKTDKAAPRARVRKARTTAPAIKSLCDIGHLAYLLESLGWATQSARIEAAIEGDASKVPDMLAEAMRSLGETLIAMTAEEVSEAIAAAQKEPVEDGDVSGLGDDATTIVLTGATPIVRKFRLGKAQAQVVKEGRKMSAATADCIKDALAKHDEAMDMHRKCMGLHKEAMKMVEGILPEAGSAQDPNEPAPGNGSAQDDSKKGLPVLMTKAARIARAIALAPIDEQAA